MQFTVLTWHDTVTPESAKNGDFESTGNDERYYHTNNIFEAARQHAHSLQELGYYEIDDDNFAGAVAYAADPEIDYDTGAEHTNCVAVLLPDTDATFVNKKLRRVYNRLVARALAK